MKTILASAYAVNPYKGSEDGMGWNFIRQIARHHRVIAITRVNNRPHIERYMVERPDETYSRIQFYYFDLPYWMRFWKKGSRGAMLYFWMWQKALPAFVRRMKVTYDIVHNVNFHNDWTPSYLWKLRKPFVWGPVGHHPLIPAQYLKAYSSRYIIKDRLAWLIKTAFWKLSPDLRRTVQHAQHILCMNSAVAHAIELEGRPHSIIPSVATDDFGYHANVVHDKFRLLSAGRLVPLKGFDLAIASYAKFLQSLDAAERSRCELVIVGSGPEKEFYKKLVANLGIRPYVTLIEWMDRSELMKLYASSAAFLFPSHEGAGMVVAEAMSFGLPIICLDNTGPGEFVTDTSGLAVMSGGVEETVESLAHAIRTLYANPAGRAQLGEGARKRFEEHFDWNVRGEQLRDIYNRLAS
jgi:glycosyltransferase involved in cell wall biosynthesis